VASKKLRHPTLTVKRGRDAREVRKGRANSFRGETNGGSATFLKRGPTLELAWEAHAMLVLDVQTPALRGLKLLHAPSQDQAYAPSEADSKESQAELILEWVENTPIHAQASSAVRAGTLIQWLEPLLQRLHATHQVGWVHGDIKPSNVLSTKAGPLLVDWAFATAAGSRLRGGTPGYLAPELRGSGYAGAAADIFALGVALAEWILSPTASLDDTASEKCDGPPSLAQARACLETLGLAEMLADVPARRPSCASLLARVGLEPASFSTKSAYLTFRSDELWLAATRPNTKVVEQGTAGAWLAHYIETLFPILSTCGSTRPRADSEIFVGDFESDPSYELDALGPYATRRLFARYPNSALETALGVAWGTSVSAPQSEQAATKPLDPMQLLLALAQGTASERDLRNAGTQPDARSGTTADATLCRCRALFWLERGNLAEALHELQGRREPQLLLIRAEIERRAHDHVACASTLQELAHAYPTQANVATKLRARFAWDQGDYATASELAKQSGHAEVLGLIAYRELRFDEGLRAVDDALRELPRAASGPLGDHSHERLEGVRGMLLHGKGESAAAMSAFARASDSAALREADLAEATYRTGLAASAYDAGFLATAIEASERAAFLFEQLGERSRAASCHLTTAKTHLLVGALDQASERLQVALQLAPRNPSEPTLLFALATKVELLAVKELSSTATPKGEDSTSSSVNSAAYEQSVEAFFKACRIATAEARVRASANLILALVRSHQVSQSVDSAATLCRMIEANETSLSPLAIVERHIALTAMSDQQTQDAAKFTAAFQPFWQRGPFNIRLEACLRLHAEARTRLDEALEQRTINVLENIFENLTADWPTAYFSHQDSSLRLLFGSTYPLVASSTSKQERALTGKDVRAARDMRDLHALLLKLGTPQSLREILSRVLESVASYTGVERALVLLPFRDRLVPRSSRSLGHNIRGSQLRFSLSLSRQALEEEKPVFAENPLEAETTFTAAAYDASQTRMDGRPPRPATGISLLSLGIRRAVAWPLRLRGETLGVLYLDDRTSSRPFAEAERQWMQCVSTLAACALANTREHVLARRALRKSALNQAALAKKLVDERAALETVSGKLSRLQANATFPRLCGASVSMLALFQMMDRYAKVEAPVLVLGESGTGKELVARSLHEHGPRSNKPFVAENCSALSESLLESALFGHAKGSFTGAVQSTSGLFAQADGGTLFLDEVGEMSLAMQAKLLRVLETGEVRPVGAPRVQKVNVRIIAATHRDLQAMVREKRFREDLYYRLSVLVIAVPPLRERKDDIPLLVQHFLRKHDDKGRTTTAAALDKLTAHPWPGNVRQLENELRRAVVLSDGTIDVAHLSAEVSGAKLRAAPPLESSLDVREHVDAVHRTLIEEAMKRTDGNVTQAASLLGLSRFGLIKIQERLGIR
jgi:serine/threonine-protein kinase PknK